MSSASVRSGCIFCRIAAGVVPASVVFDDGRYMAFLDAHPRTRGHLQLIPKQHYHWIHDLPDMGEIFSVAQTIIRVIIPVLGADHVSIGTFGHEVPHAHIWIVPQYRSSVRIVEGLSGMDDEGGDDKDVVTEQLRRALAKEV